MTMLETHQEARERSIVATELSSAFQRAQLNQGLDPYDPSKDGYNQLQELDKIRGTEEADWRWEAMYMRIATGIFGVTTAEQLAKGDGEAIRKLNSLKRRHPEVMLPKIPNPEIKSIKPQDLEYTEMLKFLNGWHMVNPAGRDALTGTWMFYQVTDESISELTLFKKSGAVALFKHEKGKSTVRLEMPVDTIELNYLTTNVGFQSKKGTLTLTSNGRFASYKPNDDDDVAIRIANPPDQVFRSILDPYDASGNI